MIDKLNFEPEDAIFGKRIWLIYTGIGRLLFLNFTEFNRARGHKIERENYLQDLHDGKR